MLCCAVAQDSSIPVVYACGVGNVYKGVLQACAAVSDCAWASLDVALLLARAAAAAVGMMDSLAQCYVLGRCSLCILTLLLFLLRLWLMLLLRLCCTDQEDLAAAAPAPDQQRRLCQGEQQQQ